MFKLVCFALVACAAATAPVISLDMDESMSLHKEKHTLAKGMNQDWVERCDAKSKPSQCPFPKARAYDSHDKAVTVTTTMWVMDIENKPQGCDRRGKNCKGKQVTKVDYNKRSTYVFKYDAKDEANNHASQVVFVLELNDVHYPELTVCGQPIQYVEGARPFHFCESKATDNVGVGAITYKMKSTTGVPVFDNKSFKEARDYIKRMVYNPRFLGKYVIYMTVNDNAGIYRKNPTDSITRGNQVIKTRGLVIRDTQKPWITITKKLKPLECAGTKKCAERSITKPFYYFNSGSAKGCEHRHHYLYEYRGSDCVWTSKPTALEALGKYTYEWMRVEFKVADYGKMEYSDYVKVEMAPCLNGKCERFYQTELIRGDTKGNLGRRSIHDRYHGWYWQTVRQAKGRNANWMYQLDKDHNQVRIRITLKSNDNYNERHILDNLEIKGWACKKQHYTVAFKAQDSHKNKAKNVFRTVIVQDTTPPQLTVTGHVSKTITHLASVKKPAHTERVNSCADTCDGSRTVTKSWSGSAFNDRKLGTYTRKYHCTDKSGNTDTEYRKYEVVDKTAPLITCGKDSISGACHTWREASRDSAYTDASAKCNDYVDSHLPVRISGDVVAMRTPGTYKIHYDCTDKSGNKASRVTRKVVVKDTTKPVITLLGKKRVVLEAGFPYADAGSTATDTLDGDVTKKVRVSGNTVDVKSSFVNHFSCAEIKAEVATATSGAYVLTTSLKQRVEVYCDFKYSRTYLAVKKGIRAHPYGTAPGSCAKYGYEMSFKASSVGSAAYNAAKEYYMEYDAEESPYFPTSKTATSNYYLCSPKGDEASLSTVNYLSEHRNWKLGASPGKYTISYRVTDKAGNKQVKVIKRKVIVQDTLPPVISLHYAKKVKNSRDKTWWSDRYNGNPASRPVTRIARHKGKNVRKGTNPFLHFMAESSSVNGWMMGAIASAVAGVALLGFSTTKASTSVPV